MEPGISEEAVREFWQASTKEAHKVSKSLGEFEDGTIHRAGLAAFAAVVQRDTLPAVWDALVSPHAEGLNAACTKNACEQVERIAREWGVSI